jgi:hypothetical protein
MSGGSPRLYVIGFDFALRMELCIVNTSTANDLGERPRTAALAAPELYPVCKAIVLMHQSGMREVSVRQLQWWNSRA